MASIDPLILKIALSLTPGFSADIIRRIADAGIDWTTLDDPGVLTDTSKLLGCNPPGLQPLLLEEAIDRARKEALFINRHNIRVSFILDDDYPWRLFNINDAPIVLYIAGNANLSPDKIVSVVGTRHISPRAPQITDNFIAKWAEMFPDLLVVSGLAYGVDAAAHSAAINHNLPTVAVMAHGLDMIYPAAHRDLANKIINSGGAIISEYPAQTKPFRGRFLERNRIVAGLADLTTVIESDIKGGAMSTARLAADYNREVCAIPGRPGDSQSAGCNALIRRHIASLIDNPQDIIDIVRWHPKPLSAAATQPILFPELAGDNKTIYDALVNASDPVQFDVISRTTGLSPALLMSLLSELEFDGIITRHPGNRFSI